MSDADDKQAKVVVAEPEIPTQALVDSGAISRSELAKLRKDYAIARFREGTSKVVVADLLGIHRQTIYDWLEHDKDFRDRILRMKSLMALGMFPKAMKTLEDSMDAMDGETRRKAANDILDHGEGRRSREAGVTINADKVMFANMSTTDIVGLVKKLGIDLIAPEPVDASKPKEAGEPEEPKVPDPPPAPELLPPVVLPAVPPAPPPAKPEITALSKPDNSPKPEEQSNDGS